MVCSGWKRHNWRKFRCLAWSDRWVLVRAAVALPIVAVLLRCWGVRRCQAVLAWLSPLGDLPLGDLVVSNDPTPDIVTAENLARVVHIAARHGLYSANCLQRSLVLWYLLRRRGLFSEIRYGTRTDNQLFQAHAWVEHAGQIIGDQHNVQEHFARFEPAPSAE